MLSILIPTYNYDISVLLEVLLKECQQLKQPIEIRIIDDASTKKCFDERSLSENFIIHHEKLSDNIGRTAVRQLLAENANYEKLLFLDADVLPKNNDFLTKYLAHCNQYDVVFGGISYKPEKPIKEKMLRWKYGHERETLSVSEREKQPYTSINSGAFCIHRSLFLKVNELLQHKRYGMDLLFKELLKSENATVLHIDNPVYHLGLETNEQFIIKALEAINTTDILEENGQLPKDARKLQQSYLKLKKWQAIGLFQLFFSAVSSMVKRNLIIGNPNLRWFDLYRLNYYIQLKKNRDA